MAIQWLTVVKTKASLLFQWFVFEGHKKKYYKSSLNLDFELRNQKIIADEISIDVNEFNHLEELLITIIKKDEHFLKDFISRCYTYSLKLIAYSEIIKNNKKLSLYSNKDLMSVYKQYQQSVLSLMPFLNTILVIDGILKKQLSYYLQKDLGIGDKKEQDLFLSKLIIPSKKSFFVKETEMLLDIALKLQKNKEIDTTKEIRNYLNKYAWMSSIAYLGKFQSEKTVRNKLNHLLQDNPHKQKKIKEQIHSKLIKDYKKVYKVIAKSKKLTEYIHLTQELLYLQTYRLDIFFLTYYNSYSLFYEIGSRFKYNVNDLVYLTGEEIIGLFNGKRINTSEVKHRQKNYALILENNNFTILSGDKVQIAFQIKQYGNEVKGMVANRGRAKGKVKLVSSLDDMSKVEKGDIIVSSMTRPELVPVLIKSAGIITDFGGILCHAAIVSREFGIPCIVGTEKATKVFKDGDLVELNAYDGIARKIII